ncbi:hypothetical protein GpartN1_g4630.t1 [Galdieria partita]|uniref:BZIP domain-containing protein n=1 Tax=Galdieria partita TaxID=83374 RepID=A0A9C7PYD4_9RHOD|nr:hypothetical protein GpartN1_g4630.t1 [Galdieria partita]
MSLDSTFMKVDSKSTNNDSQAILESLSSSSLQPHVINPSKSIETSEIMSNSLQKSSEEREPSSDCTSKESFTNSSHISPIGHSHQNVETKNKRMEQVESKTLSQEDLKRERNRRLAREFRARKKEEIRLYRSTIVNLTQKVRILAAENQKLQQIVKEIQEKKTINHNERKAEKHKDEQIQKLQKQVLLHQIILQRLKDNEKQRGYALNGSQYSSPESCLSTLPSIKTLTQMDCSTTEPLHSPDQEVQQRRLSRSFTIPSLTDIPLSNLRSQEIVDSRTSFRQQSLVDTHVDSRYTESASSSPPDNFYGFSTPSLCTPVLDSSLVYNPKPESRDNLFS